MEELDKKIQNIMKIQIQEPMGYEQRILNTIRNYKTSNFGKNKNRFIIKRRIIATICASFILVSGIVVATNIKNNKKSDRGLGDGVDTAIENGYIATPDMNYIESNVVINSEPINLDSAKVDLKIEDFFMDDVNLSVNATLKLDESISTSININEVYEIELRDFIVKDEENRIVYTTEYGVNSYIENKTNELIQFAYNMYSDNFPKSKKLYFSLNTIRLRANLQNEQPTIYDLNGEWNFELDVPEKMYNRLEEHYRVISCDNKSFDVYTAKVTDTGFEIGVIISNIERYKFDKEKYDEFIILNDAYNKGEISEEEYIKVNEWYWDWIYSNYPISISSNNFALTKEKPIPSYVENESGERFECTMSASRKCKNHFLEGDKFDFYETFNMVKNNSTQNIKVVLYYYGQPVTIELEKIESTISTSQRII